MRRAGPILILVIGLLALAVSFLPLPLPPDSTTGESRVLETKLGLDLQGGLRLEYQVLPTAERAPTRDDLAVMQSIIRNRVDKSGVSEPQVVTQGDDRIIVEMPGVQNADQVRNLVGTTGQLNFMPVGTSQLSSGQEVDPTWLATKCPDSKTSINCVLFSGDQVAAASIGANQTGQRTVDFTLRDEGKNLFADRSEERRVGKECRSRWSPYH